jgi:hypothetical protein
MTASSFRSAIFLSWFSKPFQHQAVQCQFSATLEARFGEVSALVEDRRSSSFFENLQASSLPFQRQGYQWSSRMSHFLLSRLFLFALRRHERLLASRLLGCYATSSDRGSTSDAESMVAALDGNVEGLSSWQPGTEPEEEEDLHHSRHIRLIRR